MLGKLRALGAAKLAPFILAGLVAWTAGVYFYALGKGTAAGEADCKAQLQEEVNKRVQAKLKEERLKAQRDIRIAEEAGKEKQKIEQRLEEPLDEEAAADLPECLTSNEWVRWIKS